MSVKNTTAGTEPVPYDNMSEGCDCDESGESCARHPWPAREDEAESDDDGDDAEVLDEQSDAVVHAWAIGSATRAQLERNVMASSSRYTGEGRG